MHGWLTGVAIFLALLVGLGAGNAAGIRSERSVIANECKYGGTFTVGRTGYECRKK